MKNLVYAAMTLLLFANIMCKQNNKGAVQPEIPVKTSDTLVSNYVDESQDTINIIDWDPLEWVAFCEWYGIPADTIHTVQLDNILMDVWCETDDYDNYLRNHEFIID